MIDDIIRFAYGKIDLPQEKDITFQNPGKKIENQFSQNLVVIF